MNKEIFNNSIMEFNQKHSWVHVLLPICQKKRKMNFWYVAYGTYKFDKNNLFNYF